MPVRDRDARLPSRTVPRLTAILTDAYVREAEEGYLAYAASLLLAPAVGAYVFLTPLLHAHMQQPTPLRQSACTCLWL
jgi:hypothetical protein